VHDGSINEVDPASVDNMLKDSPWKEEVVEGLASASTSAVMEDFGVKKPLDVENISEVTQDIGVSKLEEVENIIPIEGVHAKPEFAIESSIGVSSQSNFIANNNFSSTKNANNSIDAII
jgi:hypothetical protein